jgi:hypothetical protein
MLAFPFFAYLVFHFSAHGSGKILEQLHITSDFFPIPLKMVLGLIFLLLFTWIWRRPALKRWTPCAHEHCHEGTKYLHFFAIVSFCLHFFPEAVLRHEILSDLDWNNPEILPISALIGFSVHFVIDVVTGVMLSSYWQKISGKILSFVIISGVWGTAFFMNINIFDLFPLQAEGVILLLGAFLLAMFVHLPHKPVIKCSSCKH